MNKPIEIEVYGQCFSLQGGSDEAYIQELARFVDEHMRTLTQNMKTGTPTKLAILAAINIADQLFQQRRQQEAGNVEVERLTQSMLKHIDHQLELYPA